MKKNALTPMVFFAILLNDVWNSFAQLLMKKGVVYAEVNFLDPQSIFCFLSHNIGSFYLWMGILVYATNFFIWMIILSKIDLSLAMPMGSIGYVITPLMAVIFLGEVVTPLRWLAIALIILGICVLARSKHATSSDAPRS
jgi:drug/metabolite transporter (DMT)-like permease